MSKISIAKEVIDSKTGEVRSYRSSLKRATPRHKLRLSSTGEEICSSKPDSAHIDFNSNERQKGFLEKYIERLYATAYDDSPGHYDNSDDLDDDFIEDEPMTVHELNSIRLDQSSMARKAKNVTPKKQKAGKAGDESPKGDSKPDDEQSSENTTT